MNKKLVIVIIAIVILFVVIIASRNKELNSSPKVPAKISQLKDYGIPRQQAQQFLNKINSQFGEDLR